MHNKRMAISNEQAAHKLFVSKTENYTRVKANKNRNKSNLHRLKRNKTKKKFPSRQKITLSTYCYQIKRKHNRMEWNNWRISSNLKIALLNINIHTAKGNISVNLMEKKIISAE